VATGTSVQFVLHFEMNEEP